MLSVRGKLELIHPNGGGRGTGVGSGIGGIGIGVGSGGNVGSRSISLHFALNQWTQSPALESNRNLWIQVITIGIL